MRSRLVSVSCQVQAITNNVSADARHTLFQRGAVRAASRREDSAICYLYAAATLYCAAIHADKMLPARAHADYFHAAGAHDRGKRR